MRAFGLMPDSADCVVATSAGAAIGATFTTADGATSTFPAALAASAPSGFLNELGFRWASREGSAPGASPDHKARLAPAVIADAYDAARAHLSGREHPSCTRSAMRIEGGVDGNAVVLESDRRVVSAGDGAAAYVFRPIDRFLGLGDSRAARRAGGPSSRRRGCS
jgi:hypothetical protein